MTTRKNRGKSIKRTKGCKKRTQKGGGFFDYFKIPSFSFFNKKPDDLNSTAVKSEDQNSTVVKPEDTNTNTVPETKSTNNVDTPIPGGKRSKRKQ